MTARNCSGEEGGHLGTKEAGRGGFHEGLVGPLLPLDDWEVRFHLRPNDGLGLCLGLPSVASPPPLGWSLWAPALLAYELMPASSSLPSTGSRLCPPRAKRTWCPRASLSSQLRISITR